MMEDRFQLRWVAQNTVQLGIPLRTSDDVPPNLNGVLRRYGGQPPIPGALTQGIRNILIEPDIPAIRGQASSCGKTNW